MGKKQKLEKIDADNLVFISDLHSGDKYSLCPPIVKFDEGGSHKASKYQLVLYDFWKHCWEKWLPPRLMGNKEYALIFNGDGIEGLHHKSSTPVSNNINDHIEIAEMLLKPIVDKCAKNKNGQKEFFAIRGTGAHVGSSGENDERIAKDLGAKRNNLGQYARYNLKLNFKGKLGHIAHHIGVPSRTSSEATSLMTELAEEFTAAGRWGRETFDFLVRSHRHSFLKVELPTYKGNSVCISTPGWQLKYPHIYRSIRGRTNPPQFGIVLMYLDWDGTIITKNIIGTLNQD